MAKRNEVQLTATTLNEIPKMVDICQQIAEALIETGEQWSREALLFSSFLQTDYERARKEIIKKCISASQHLRTIRKKTLSPDAIRARGNISKILECCGDCPAANQRNLTNKKAFCCLVQARLGEGAKDEFRFRLDDKGQIIETR